MLETSADALRVDEGRFTGDGADLFLLHWLRHAEQAIEVLPPESLLSNIQSLHDFFLKLLLPTPSNSLPKPGRPVRHLITRCLVKLHKRVESRSLFDLVQALVRGVGDGGGGGKGMSSAENVGRVACWYVIGEVIKELGTNMMSFMAEICTSSMRVLRNSNLACLHSKDPHRADRFQSVILRSHALAAFSKSLQSAGRALPDALVKDLLKALRSGLSDRALPIQRACAETFISLHTYTSACPLQTTLDSVAPLVFKSLETGDYLTRRSLSRLLGHLLAATQVPGSGVNVAEPGKKTVAKKDTDPEGSEPTVVTSAAEDRAGRTLFTPAEMLRQLSTVYNRPTSSRKLRNAIIDVYATLFTALGATYVENQYVEIVKHIVEGLILPGRGQSSRHEVFATREVVGLLLRDLIGIRLLSEAGQVMAIREWTSTYLKKWSAQPLPGQPRMNKNVLVIALREVAGMLEQLGNAPPAILELLGKPLIRLLSHDSYAVRLMTAYTLRRFCTLNPSQLSRMLESLLGDVTKDLGILGLPTASKELPGRLIGKTFALSAVLAINPARPLYVAHDLSTKVFDLAVTLLKKAGEHDISPATVEIQVAWYLIAALMSLGPSFVKGHLPQLLILWRNALPKPTSKDSSVGERGEAEWSFLLLVRECTLAAVLNFLRHNQSLVNIDVARRLATLFTNSLNFVNGFATAYAEALREQSASVNGQTTPIVIARPSLVDRESKLRRRVLQCFTSLSPSSATEAMQPALLQAAMTVFADPENYSGSAAQAAIAAQAGQFTSIWQATDDYAFGVTSLLGGREAVGGPNTEEAFLNRDRIEMSIESQLSHPILGSLEHDFLDILPAKPLPVPPTPVSSQTGVIDAGVDLFSVIFPQQNVERQVSSLTTLSSHVRSGKLERNPGRRQAVLANTITALRRSLANVDAIGARGRKILGSPQVSEIIKSLLQDAVLEPSPNIREAAAEAMGMLSSFAGSAYLSSQIQWLVDQVVNNRVPESRAGCALAFGAIYSNVGGLAGGPILKTIVNILMSLATDPHPVVHFYAMSALTQVVNAANLSYEPYIPTTLGMLANIYLLETHEPDGGSLGSVNIRGDLPAYQVICRILHALVGVLGPELQEPGKIRSLVFLLVHEFGEEIDEGLAVEAIKCVQQFLMFAPAEVDVPKLLETFRAHLASSRRPLKVAAITALYQIVQRDAVLISKLGGNQLVEDLFGLLDDDPSLEGVRNVITSWLQQTAAALPSGWIDLCQRIMTRTAASAAAQKAAAEERARPVAAASFIDDEGQSLGLETTNASTALSSRWRTQLFALGCLHNIMRAVADGGKPEHFDPNLAKRMGLNPRQMLSSRVADLIRMAFSASAALVMEVRLQGLAVLRDVIEGFSTSADPDFDGALLLEQHQAPIAAALTPSFGSDSAPEVLASAVQVCAVFVGSGVVKEVSRMGRILKLLSGALEQCKDGAMLSLGDVEDLSSNAAVMLKISILAAWAELQVASSRQVYLTDVVRPHAWLLGPFWVGALRDYAQLRTDPEMGATAGLDFNSGLGRDVLLPYYEKAVPKLLQAVASAMLKSDAFVLGALDGQTFPSPAESRSTRRIQSEPALNFYIIYGLAFESLVKSMGDTSTTLMAQVCLKAMQSLVKPQLSGIVFEGALFDELCTVCYRIAMGEGAGVKVEMCEIMKVFVTSRRGVQGDDPAQTRRALAIITFVLRQTIPTIDTPSSFTVTDSASDRIAFFKTAFAAYSTIVGCIEPAQRADLCAVGLHLFGDLLKDEAPGVDFAGPTLPVLKMLVDQAMSGQVPGVGATGERIVHGLLSACFANIDEMRARVNPVATVKIKNNLLAITLVLTTLPASVQVSKEVVEQASFVIGQYFGAATERPELGLTAIHCGTTLLLASLRLCPSSLPDTPPSPSAVLQHGAVHLLSPMITFIAEAVVDESKAPVEGTRELVKGLVGWCSDLTEPLRPRAYAILLPTLCLLLDPPGSPLHAIATTTMLGLAQSSPVAFRDATNSMSEGDRGKLEKAVREAVSARDQGKMGGGQGLQNAEKRGIELKSFG